MYKNTEHTKPKPEPSAKDLVSEFAQEYLSHFCPCADDAAENLKYTTAKIKSLLSPIVRISENEITAILMRRCFSWSVNEENFIYWNIRKK